MPSHIIDQSVLNPLPELLLLKWAAALTTSPTRLALLELTLALLEILFIGLADRYDVRDYCQAPCLPVLFAKV